MPAAGQGKKAVASKSDPSSVYRRIVIGEIIKKALHQEERLEM